MKDLKLLVIVSLIAWLIIMISDFAWAGDLKLADFGIIKKINTRVSSYEIKQALEAEEAERTKTRYNKLLELVASYTTADFNITPACRLQWNLNKLNAEYRFDHGGNLFNHTKVNFSGFTTEFGYRITF